MANEFIKPDVATFTTASTSPYASPVTVGAPPNMASSVDGIPIAGAGDAVSSLTPEKRLLNIINSKLGTAYDNIDEAKTAVNDLTDDTESITGLKALVAKYDEAKGDVTKQKSALSTYENKYNNPVSGIPSIPPMSDFSAAGGLGVPLSPTNMPATPVMQQGTNDPLSAIPQALQGLSGIGTAFNPNGSQTAGTDGKPSASANIPVGYKEEFEKTTPAGDINWTNPEGIKDIKGADETAKAVNEPIDAVSANFNSEDGSYILNSNETDKQKQQVTADMGKIGTAIAATNEDAKNTYLSDGNGAATKLFDDGKKQTDEVHGSPINDDPKIAVDKDYKGKKIPEAYKAEYKKVQDKSGLEEDDAENKGKVTDKYSSETKKDDVESIIGKKYGKEEDNVGVLQGKLDYLTGVAGVEQGAQADYAKAQSDKTQAETAKNMAIQNGRVAAANGQDTTYYQQQVRDAEAKIKEAEEKMKERKEVLDAAKEKKPKIEEKLKASAEARTKELTAIKSGTNSEVAKAIKAKQTDADAVQKAVNEVVSKVQNGATAGKENEAATFAEMVAPSNANLFKDASGIVNKFNGEVKTLNANNKEKVAQLTKTKEMLKKILVALTNKDDEKGKGVKIDADGDTGKQKVTVKTGANDDQYKFDLSGAKAKTETSENSQARVNIPPGLAMLGGSDSELPGTMYNDVG